MHCCAMRTFIDVLTRCLYHRCQGTDDRLTFHKDSHDFQTSPCLDAQFVALQLPKADNTPCDDGLANTLNDVCVEGKCETKLLSHLACLREVHCLTLADTFAHGYIHVGLCGGIDYCLGYKCKPLDQCHDAGGSSTCAAVP